MPAPTSPTHRNRATYLLRPCRHLLIAVVLIAVVFSSSAAAHTANTTSTFHKTVFVSGIYKITLSVQARTHGEKVKLTVGEHRTQSVTATTRGIHLTYSLKLTHKRGLIIRAQASRAVRLKVLLFQRQKSKNPLPSTPAPASPLTPAPSPVTAPLPSTPVSTAPTSPEPLPGSPNTTPLWTATFNGPAGQAPSPSQWSLDNYGTCGGGTLSTNTSALANAQTDGKGDLAITALSDENGSYTSARLDTVGKFSFTYGTVEARIWMPAGQGLCSAFWMLGDSSSSNPCGGSQCGELDIVEAPAFGPLPTFAEFTLHGPIDDPSSGQLESNTQQFNTYTSSLGNLAAGYHTYAVSWSPGLIVWSIDGTPYASATPSSLAPGSQWMFNGRPFHILLDLYVGGWPGNPSGEGEFPTTMLVNWVAVYT